MKRGLLIIFLGAIIVVAVATDAWCQCLWDSKDATSFVLAGYGTTNITWPKVLFTVNVDNYGKVTGTGSQVKISHSDPGTFCHKVAYARVCLYDELSKTYLLVRPSKKNLNLCNFNERDTTFDIVFPGSDNPQEIQKILESWVSVCQGGGYYGRKEGGFWGYYDDVVMDAVFMWANKNFHGVGSTRVPRPPVAFNCAPCPPLNVLRTSIDLKANTPVSIPWSSFVSGGIPPYSVTFQKAPTDMRQDGGTQTLTGTPIADQSIDFQTKITVRDSCKSQKIVSRTRVGDFTFRIKKDPATPTLTGLFISPQILPATGGDVVFKVTASDDKAVTAVHAAVSSQGWSRSVTVNRVSGNEKSGIWQGTYKAPPNTINQNVGYKIDLIAIDSDGNKSNPLSNWFPVMGTPGGSTPPTQYKYKK